MTREQLRVAVTAAALSLLSARTPAKSIDVPEDPLFRAVAEEMQRATESLELDGHKPPYFISAVLSDYTTVDVGAEFGGLLQSTRSRDRLLEVFVRVGDPDSDNSNFLRAGRFPQLPGPEMPEDDGIPALRRAVWQAIDEAYKSAIEDLSRKRAADARQTKSVDDVLPDFVEQKPIRTLDPATDEPFPRAKWEKLARKLSAVFLDHPRLHEGQLRLTGTRRTVRYIDTGGTVARHTRYLHSLQGQAAMPAQDGMPIRDFVSAYAARASDFPSESELVAEVEALCQRIERRAAAPVFEDGYSGPVLLEDQAVAELLLQLAGHGAQSSPTPVFEDPRFASAFDRVAGPSPWRGRLGKKVMSRTLSVVDDPTMREYDGLRLIGSYRADDEGIPPRRVSVVEDGILTAQIGTRTPSKGSLASTGHGRLPPSVKTFLGAGRAVPGVLIVRNTKDDAVSTHDVRALFLEMLDEEDLEHGYLIRRVRNHAADPPSQEGGRRNRRDDPPPVGQPLEVVRVAIDGTETVVRGVEWGKLDHRALKDIVTASSGDGGERAYNIVTPLPGMPRLGLVTTSVIAPRALLIEELELSRESGPFPTLPTLPPPGLGEPSQ